MPTENNFARVFAIQDNDKFAALAQVLEQTDFYDLVERQLVSSGKPRADFLVAIKPNIMMARSLRDCSSYTDPQLVEHLVDGLVQRGFTNVAVVESQNMYGNWFRNREVIPVATYFGYSAKNYRVVDLTQEMVEYDYGGRLGKHWIGPTWRDADFRISFAKNKTHPETFCTLTLKNVYGCLPLQDKIKEYHQLREFDWPTIELLKHAPCHYGLIDAIWSADGLMGAVSDSTPKHTRTIIGGENLLAVDWVGAKKMGLEPYDSRILALAETAFGMPEVEWVGDHSGYEGWVNVPGFMDEVMDITEELGAFTNWVWSLGSDMDAAFPRK